MTGTSGHLGRMYRRLTQWTVIRQGQLGRRSSALIQEAGKTGTLRPIPADALLPLRKYPVLALEMCRSGVSRTTSPGVSPLMAFSSGCALLHIWNLAAAALALLVLTGLLPRYTHGEWAKTLSTIIGLFLYACAACLLWFLAGQTTVDWVPALLGGLVLLSLSFSAWLSSLFFKGLGAWVSGGVAILALTAATLICGSQLASGEQPWRWSRFVFSTSAH
jgi:hypothetical protein